MAAEIPRAKGTGAVLATSINASVV